MRMFYSVFGSQPGVNKNMDRVKNPKVMNTEKPVRLAIMDWIRSGPDLTVGEPNMQEALERFVAYIKVRELNAEATRARPKATEMNPRHTPKF